MKNPLHANRLCAVFVPFLFLAAAAAVSAQAPQGQLETGLSYKPIQKDVEIDIPTAEEIKLCEMRLSEDRRGFIITGPQKNILRVFLDVNGDNRVDQWSYFKNGVEVYRDIDADGNGAADQFRWLNNAGTRWGVDTDGNREIDYWKTISPEEVSREVVLALSTGDVKRFLRVVLSKEELADLSLGKSLNATVASKVETLQTGFTEAVKAVGLGREIQWYQLNVQMPGLVPAGDRDNKNDLFVYENAMATVGDGGETKQISIGTLVRVGEGNWRTLDLPKMYDENQFSYTFILPVSASPGVASPADNEVISLIREAQEIQAEIPGLPVERRADKHKEVIALMIRIIAKSATPQDRDLWIRQLADTIMEAVQRNEFPQGGEQLKVLFETVRRDGDDELAAHVRSRQIMTDYYRDIQTSDDELKPHMQWLENLEAFVGEFEKTEAGIEGMMQLASYREMVGKSAEEPLKWYAKVAEAAAGKPVAKKAEGAVRRLRSPGQTVSFKANDVTGKAFDVASLRGGFVLLCFWDSRVADELSAIQAVAAKFGGLNVVGVNLDPDTETLRASLGRVRLPWTQLYAPGGIDNSPLAVYWGIPTTPYMILYGKDGKIVNANVQSSGDLQRIMAELTK